MRIPKELAFVDGAQDVEVERVGNTLVLRPVPPEHHRELERLLSNLPPEVFQASDSLGWVYQFWQPVQDRPGITRPQRRIHL